MSVLVFWGICVLATLMLAQMDTYALRHGLQPVRIAMLKIQLGVHNAPPSVGNPLINSLSKLCGTH